jgi:hypothetical protein
MSQQQHYTISTAAIALGRCTAALMLPVPVAVDLQRAYLGQTRSPVFRKKARLSQPSMQLPLQALFCLLPYESTLLPTASMDQ